MTRRLLLIAYQFPPVGGAGVQRVTKLCKYLPQRGWSVSVLTAANHSVPTHDASLGQDIPAETVIRTARSFEPGYAMKRAVQASQTGEQSPSGLRQQLRGWLRYGAAQVLQPDPQILWVPDAVRQGRQLLQEMQHDAILVSGPPFSSFLVGAKLQKASGLPLVLDYRDEWGLANRYWENKSDSAATRWVQRRMQSSVIRRAHTLVATTELSAEALRNEATNANREIPVRCIYNGFDPDDFSAETTLAATEDRLRVAHVGTLWRLTSANPLVAAIERLARETPELAGKLDLDIVGRCTPAEKTSIESLRSLPCRLNQRDYVDHSTAVDVMQNADELCLLLADVAGSERVVPGKTFEYLASGRRILAIAPEGEVQRLLEPHAGVATFRPDQVTEIAQHLADSIRRVGQHRIQAPQRSLERFDRRAQAAEMADLLSGLADSRSAHSAQSSSTLVTASH